MKLRSNILRATSAVVIAAILAAVGGFASPSSAVTDQLGNSELQAAYTKTEYAMINTGVIYTPPSILGGIMSYELVLAPKSKLVPGNMGLSLMAFGISSAMIYNFNNGNPMGSSLGAESLIGQSYEVVYPDDAGWEIGQPTSNGTILEDYEVSMPDDSTYAVHVVKSDLEQTDENGDPILNTTDYVFTVTNGLITRIEQSADTYNSLVSGNTVSTFDFSTKSINSHWATLVASWKATHFDASTSALATKLTKAFTDSETAARKLGVTINETSKSNPGIATYDAAKKKSVEVIFNSKKIPTAVAFTDAPETLSSMWANVLGTDVFKSKGIKYSAKTRTYDLKGQAGLVAKIKVDSKGRIISTSVEGSLPETRTVTYSANKTIMAKWGTLGPKSQALVQWVLGLRYALLSAQVSYFKKGTLISAKGKLGSQNVETFDTKGIKATDVTKVFSLLGLKLGKG